jgi:PAS domain S-box-containing protein
MLSWIKEFLTSPTFADEDKTQVARLLYVLSKIGLAGAAILVFIFAFITRRLDTRLIATLIAIPILIFEMVLVRKGYVRFAAFFVVVTTWIGGNYTIINTGGVQTVGFGINLIIVLEAGMLISLRAGLVFAVISSLAGLGMATAQAQGWTTPIPSEINIYAAWATQSLFLGLMAGLLYISVNQIHQSLVHTKRTEARLRGIIDNAPDIIIEADPTGIITLINSNQDLYLGKQVREFIHVDDIPKVNKTIEQAFATGKSGSLEVRSLAPDGGYIWASIRVGPITEEGRVSNLAVIVSDINEQKLAENTLRESEARYRGLLENMPAIVYIIGVGQEPVNPTIFESPQIEKLLGYTRAEFYNDPVFWTNLIHPDDRERVWIESKRADQTGEPFLSDYRIISKEQRIFWFHDESVLVKDDLGQPLYRLGVCTDITERKRAEENIQNQLERLNALHNIDNAIKSNNDLDITLRILLDELTTQLRVDAAAVLLFNHLTMTLEYAASRGFHSTALQSTKLEAGEGYAGRVMVDRKTIHIPDLAKTDNHLAQVLSRAGENFKTYIASPLIAKDQVVGVLEIFHYLSLAPNPEWFNFLDILTGQAAIAIENAQLLRSLQRSNSDLALAYDATIEGMSRALDLRDKETEGHTQRVTTLTVKLAQQMGVPETEIIHIRRGALLHDIGKLGVPDNILLKPKELTPREWDIMRQHTSYAYGMLSPIHYLRPALDIPFSHHEKWDGTGYPRGLNGDQIPLAARIFAIVDVYDALTSNRPYRKAWSLEETLKYIRSMNGTHFDPTVVEWFFRVVSEKT